MWVEIFLVVIILILLGWILFSSSGIYRQRKSRREISVLQEELRRMRDANEALREALGVGAGTRLKRYGNLFEFVRDLDSLRSAIAGSKGCQDQLARKYNMGAGPELLARILAQPGIDSEVKERLADELMVGEVGRAIARSLNAGASIERAAAEAGVPLIVAKGQVTRLQILGYLDSRLKLTERGQKALI